MATIYYIDSENVGDRWIELLENSQNSDSRFIVFYTGHSPRIAYPQVIQLINNANKPKFIKCHEGNNGLDFQLVSYLGYELHVDHSNEMIIVSNDTGFDAVVLFWKERGMNVRRVSRKNSSSLQSIEKQEPVSDDEVATSPSSVEVTERISGIEKKEIYTIINCIGTEDLSHVHLAYVNFYGKKNGETIYKYMKQEKFATPSVLWTKETRMKKLIELIMTYSPIVNLSYPAGFSAFLINHIDDDKCVMSNKMTQTFGGQSSQLHKVFKPFYKTLSKIKTK